MILNSELETGAPYPIRPARADERAALEALQRRASLQNEHDRPHLLAHPESIHLPPEHLAAGWVFVAEARGRVGGFSVVLPRPDGDAELDGLFVEPGIWRRGLGRALVAHAAATARERGARHLHVVGNPHAAAFYTACGFVTTGSTSTQFGPGLAMVLPLAPASAANSLAIDCINPGDGP